MEERSTADARYGERSHDIAITAVDITRSSVERLDVGDHVVEIRTFVGRQDLWIDGIYQNCAVTSSGYKLYCDAYVPPQKSLLNAVEAYLRIQRPCVQPVNRKS